MLAEGRVLMLTACRVYLEGLVNRVWLRLHGEAICSRWAARELFEIRTTRSCRRGLAGYSEV